MNIKIHDDDTRGTSPIPLFDLHQISVEQLAELGVQQIAYVRPVLTVQGAAFGVFAANGAPLAVADSEELARAAIMQSDMAPVSVH